MLSGTGEGKEKVEYIADVFLDRAAEDAFADPNKWAVRVQCTRTEPQKFMCVLERSLGTPAAH
jgi:hypothetical protein